MFNSSLEVARFEGAQIKTVSGIRGQIKKAINKPEGCFRATFEDKIKLSDIVFCRTWFKVNVPQFYNPMITLLLAPEERQHWKGARTLGQIKHDENIRNLPNEDSLYKEIKRKPKVFKPLVVPKKLQAALPYKNKPKLGVLSNEKKKKMQRVAVIREPHEEKVSKMMQMLRTSFEHKQTQHKKTVKQNMKNYKKEIQQIEERKLKKLQVQKKQVMKKRQMAAAARERKMK